LLLAGKGVAKDVKRGRGLLEQACNDGIDEACTAIGKKPKPPGG